MPKPADHRRTDPPPRPYRWTLSGYGGGRPDRIGELPEPPPHAGDGSVGEGYLDALVDCTAKVLARAAGGDLCFFGRSLDGMYDLLSGALEQSGWGGRIDRIPLSAGNDACWTRAERMRFREHLAAAGLSPYALARCKRSIALVDVVDSGSTFSVVHGQLRAWIEESREPWPVIRRNPRYVGVTPRGKPSPNHRRWHQDLDWVRTLPADHVVSVSMHGCVWREMADHEPKLTGWFPSWRWLDADQLPGVVRHRNVAPALTRARALVDAGRTREVRGELVRLMARDPGFARREVRALAGALRG